MFFWENGTIAVSGALADTIHISAPRVAQGKANKNEIGQFLPLMGIMYHEAFYLGFASLSPKKRPDWYAAEQDRGRGAGSRKGSMPVLAVEREDVVDEALGGYVEGSVTAYLDAYGKLAALKRGGAVNPAAVAMLRKEYNAAATVNRAKTHGYWRVPWDGYIERWAPRVR